MNQVLRDRDHDHDMNAWPEIEPVLSEFAQRTDLTLIVGCPHGEFSDPKTEPGKLFIRFWSKPTGLESRDSATTEIRRAFGIELASGQYDAFRPSEEDGWLIEDDQGVKVAQVVSGTLYVLFDLPHRNGCNAARLLEMILERYQARTTAGSPERQFGIVRNRGGNMYEYFEGAGGVKSVLKRWSQILSQEVWIQNHHNYDTRIPAQAKTGVVKIQMVTMPPDQDDSRQKRRAFSRPVSDHLWGIALSPNQMDYSLPPSRRTDCQRIIDPASKVVVAEVIADNIYILPAIIYGPTAPALMDKILEEYVKIKLSPEEFRAAFEQYERALVEESKKSWAKFCLAQTQAQLNFTNIQEEESNNAINKATETLIVHTRNLDIIRSQKAALEALLVNNNQRQEQEYAKIMAIAGVEKVVLSDQSVISIDIGQIDIADQGKVYDIGKFQLVVDLKTGKICCFNLTRRARTSRSQHHPHVNGSGEPCLGNIKEAVTKMIARYEIATLIIVMQQFLRTYNAFDPFARIENFPLKEAT